MSLTVTEANAINTLLRFLVRQPGRHSKADAVDAAVLLADHAYQRLGAGMSGDAVRSLLHHRRTHTPDERTSLV